MSSSREARAGWTAPLVVLTLLAGTAVAQPRPAAGPAATMFEGIGRVATPKEVAAWDIDVRPDFKGLPKGSGSVARGQVVWEAKCASCHGVFGESNEVFNPVAGGTTARDIQTGRVARLTDESFPGRTTLMKLSTVSTLWDYIHRAMPWNAPKSLTVEEVYATTAFVLNLGGIVPDDFVLSDANIAQVQQRLPNRLGKTTDHGLWPGRSLGGSGSQRASGPPDVRAAACMRNCATEPKVASLLPDHARNAHGNLADQNRAVGPQVGADTTTAPGTAPRRGGPAAGLGVAAATATPSPASVASAAPTQAQALARKHNCLTCHGLDNKVVGPGLREVARKYAGRGDAGEYFARKIVEGGTGVWGAIPMPAQTLPAADAQALAAWLVAGAP